jgi:hypothetical protein
MRKKKPIVLVSIVFILSLTVIFNNAEQDKRRKVNNSSYRDIYSLKNKILNDKFFGPRNIQPLYSPPKKDNMPEYVPGEIVIEFKMPLSDFDADYLIGDYLYKRFGRLDSNLSVPRRKGNNQYRIGLPENCSVEHMVQVIERSPYVEYAEPNNIVQLYDALRGDDKRQFLEALRNEDTLHEDIPGEAYLVPAASNVGQEAVKKYNEIPPYPETDNHIRKIQSSDKKPIIRSKAKIYKFRDSEGRLVITNDYLYKSNANKK